PDHSARNRSCSKCQTLFQKIPPYFHLDCSPTFVGRSKPSRGATSRLMGKIETLVFPPTLEPVGRQFGVAHGVLYVPMPEIGLQPSCIETLLASAYPQA